MLTLKEHSEIEQFLALLRDELNKEKTKEQCERYYKSTFDPRSKEFLYEVRFAMIEFLDQYLAERFPPLKTIRKKKK